MDELLLSDALRSPVLKEFYQALLDRGEADIIRPGLPYVFKRCQPNNVIMARHLVVEVGQFLGLVRKDYRHVASPVH